MRSQQFAMMCQRNASSVRPKLTTEDFNVRAFTAMGDLVEDRMIQEVSDGKNGGLLLVRLRKQCRREL